MPIVEVDCIHQNWYDSIRSRFLFDCILSRFIGIFMFVLLILRFTFEVNSAFNEILPEICPTKISSRNFISSTERKCNVYVICRVSFLERVKIFRREYLHYTYIRSYRIILHLVNTTLRIRVRRSILNKISSIIIIHIHPLCCTSMNSLSKTQNIESPRSSLNPVTSHVFLSSLMNFVYDVFLLHKFHLKYFSDAKWYCLIICARLHVLSLKNYIMKFCTFGRKISWAQTMFDIYRKFVSETLYVQIVILHIFSTS